MAVGAVCCEPLSGKFACYSPKTQDMSVRLEALAISFRVFRGLIELGSNSFLSKIGR